MESMEERTERLLNGEEVGGYTLKDIDHSLKKTCPRFYDLIEKMLGETSVSEPTSNDTFIRELPDSRKLFYWGALPVFLTNFDWPRKDKELERNSNLLEQYFRCRRIGNYKLKQLLGELDNHHRTFSQKSWEEFNHLNDRKTTKIQGFLICLYEIHNK